jgi:hypothetical protein
VIKEIKVHKVLKEPKATKETRVQQEPKAPKVIRA